MWVVERGCKMKNRGQKEQYVLADSQCRVKQTVTQVKERCPCMVKCDVIG